MGEDRGKGSASGRSHVPKTAAGRARQLEKIARRRERLQRELAAAKRTEAAIAAAVRADGEKARAGLERAAGRMILGVIEEKRALAASGDEWAAAAQSSMVFPRLSKASSIPASNVSKSSCPSPVLWACQ